jgi:hypothetical protein
MTEARRGWNSDFARFRVVDARTVLESLRAFIPDAGESQIRAWRESVPPLQHEVGEVIDQQPDASGFTTILEYELPLDSRRADVVVLTDRVVIVLELKGKAWPSESDLDQAAAYGRDLRHYHAACANRPVEVLLVATRGHGILEERRGIRVIGPDRIDGEIARIAATADPAVPPLDPAEFLAEDAYRPLPTIVQAARELFFNHEIRRVHRAHANTEPTVNCVQQIVARTAEARGRALILIAGTPGSGKTLVGLRAVHAQYLDQLAVDVGGRATTQPAVFLSGNGPLVEVLQYELRDADSAGKTFVKPMFDFIGQYAARPTRTPQQHVIVFDEAQRAFDAAMVREKYAKKNSAAAEAGLSQPELLTEIAERIPEWSVLVGLVGEGQHIHKGEEGGIEQWAKAIQRSGQEWTVYAPPHLRQVFRQAGVEPVCEHTLNLDVELRFHLAQGLHEFVRGILDIRDPGSLRTIGEQLARDGMDLRLTRDLGVAKEYLRNRFADYPSARFGIIASSRDKRLRHYGIMNDFQSTKRIRVGPWFGDSESDSGRQSCRLLEETVTEFQCQGLELDAALLAWGNDFVLSRGTWDISGGSQFARGGSVPVRDPQALRANSYRVLMTRGRAATVVWMPPEPAFDETHDYLANVGFRAL